MESDKETEKQKGNTDTQWETKKYNIIKTYKCPESDLTITTKSFTTMKHKPKEETRSEDEIVRTRKLTPRQVEASKEAKETARLFKKFYKKD